MKKFLVFFVVLLLTISFVNAQNVIQSKSIDYNGSGSISLENGTTLNGNIYFSVMGSSVIYYAPKPEGTTKKVKPKTYKIKDIKSFTIAEDSFVKIQSTTTTRLVKVLLNNKIKIFDATHQSNIIAGNTDGNFDTYIEYWVLFPQKDKAININDITLTAKKVSDYVSDCQGLSQKILVKLSGYNTSALQPANILLQIYIGISNEYENCGQ